MDGQVTWSDLGFSATAIGVFTFHAVAGETVKAIRAQHAVPRHTAVLIGIQTVPYAILIVHPCALRVPRIHARNLRAHSWTVYCVQRVALIRFPAFPVASGCIGAVNAVSLQAENRLVVARAQRPAFLRLH